MPAKKSALRASKRADINGPHRTRARTMVAQAKKMIQTDANSLAEEAVRHAASILDRAAAKGVIHKNNAARRTSRMWLQFNANQGEDTTKKEPSTPRRTTRSSSTRSTKSGAKSTSSRKK